MLELYSQSMKYYSHSYSCLGWCFILQCDQHCLNHYFGSSILVSVLSMFSVSVRNHLRLSQLQADFSHVDQGIITGLPSKKRKKKILCLVCRNHRSLKLRLCVLCKRRRALPSCNPERCWVQGAMSCRDCLHHHIEDLFDPLVAARIMQYV